MTPYYSLSVWEREWSVRVAVCRRVWFGGIPIKIRFETRWQYWFFKPMASSCFVCLFRSLVFSFSCCCCWWFDGWRTFFSVFSDWEYCILMWLLSNTSFDRSFACASCFFCCVNTNLRWGYPVAARRRFLEVFFCFLHVSYLPCVRLNEKADGSARLSLIALHAELRKQMSDDSSSSFPSLMRPLGAHTPPIFVSLRLFLLLASLFFLLSSS